MPARRVCMIGHARNVNGPLMGAKGMSNNPNPTALVYIASRGKKTSCDK